MEIVVTFHGQARTVAGTHRHALEVDPGASVRDVLHILAARHGPAFRALVLSDDGAVRQSVLVPVDDEVVDNEAPGTLRAGVELAVLPAMAGG